MQVAFLACLAVVLVLAPAAHAQDEIIVDGEIVHLGEEAHLVETNADKDSTRESAIEEAMEDSPIPGVMDMHTGLCWDANCQFCPQSDDTCTGCHLMYAAINGECLQSDIVCPEFCTECEPSADMTRAICTACEYLYEVNGERCYPQCLVNNCTTCSDVNGYECVNCNNDFTLTDDSTECYANCLVENCMRCEFGTHYECAQCSHHYAVDLNIFPNDASVCRSQCRVDHCIECPEGSSDVCSECEYPFAVDGEGQCEFQCQVFHCIECLPGRPERCKICEDGYGRDNHGQCIIMDMDCWDPNCIQCKSATTTCGDEEEGSNRYCGACLVGWSLNNCECVDTENECGKWCLDCQSVENEDTGDIKFECWECDEGYNMEGNHCAPTQANTVQEVLEEHHADVGSNVHA